MCSIHIPFIVKGAFLMNFKMFCLTLLSASAFNATAQPVLSTMMPVATDSGFNQRQYFTSRPDLRKCVSPLCGGLFVKQVNKNKTRCADGSLQNECYVAEVDWSAISSDPIDANDNLLLQGTIASKTFDNFGNLGIFKAQAAYTPVVDKVLKNNNTFVGLENNGIVCITTPCFSVDEHVLNSSKIRPISSINLENVGATQAQVTAAYDMMAQEGVLLAAGVNRQEQGVAGLGLTFTARQFYLPINTATGKCPEGYEANGEQCVTPFGCIAPEIELQAHGGAAFVDPVTGETKSTITTSCVTSCESPAVLDAPARCSVFYP
jgi:hypothetical protein